MTDTNTTSVPLPYRSVWQHKRKPLTAVVNHVLTTDVQVFTNDRKYLKWLSIRGFLRDYEPTGETEPVVVQSTASVLQG